MFENILFNCVTLAALADSFGGLNNVTRFSYIIYIYIYEQYYIIVKEREKERLFKILLVIF